MTPIQEALSFWLRHYDAFFEVSAIEDGVPSWLVKDPFLVDSFFTWHEAKRKEEREQYKHPDTPKATEHGTVLKNFL